MRIISHDEVERLISMREAIESVRQAFIELSSGSAQVPVRLAISPGKHPGATLVMPGYLGEADALVTKIVSVRPENTARGLPLIYGIVILFDPATGEPLALIEGRSLTALRTGAAGGLAAELLAREDASTAAIIGAGAQAATQLAAVCAVRPVKRVLIYARRPEKVHALIDAMRPRLGPEIELIAALSVSQAVREADLICTATTSSTPVFDGADLRPGAHINGIGSFTPAMQEVDFTTLRRASRIVVDSYEGAMAEAGDLIMAIERGVIRPEDIYGELGEIASGKKPGRAGDDEITFFKSVGNAAQDATVAQAIYRAALAAAQM